MKILVKFSRVLLKPVYSFDTSQVFKTFSNVALSNLHFQVRSRPIYRHSYIFRKSFIVTSRSMSEKKPFERLPKDVVPENYVLELQPHLSNFTFDGKQEIAIEVNYRSSRIEHLNKCFILQVKNEVSSITMNSCDIEIKDVWIECGGN